MLLLILDSLGGTELLVILVVALVIFGPRKLPQLSRSLGRSLADFKRASQDFKETWEKEARMEDDFKQDSISRAMLPPEEGRTTTIGQTVGRDSPFSATDVTETSIDAGASANANAPAIDTTASAPLAASEARGASPVPLPSIRPVPADSSLVQNSGGDSHSNAETHPATEQTRKQDWL